mgnify:CR=1 FL=1
MKAFRPSFLSRLFLSKDYWKHFPIENKPGFYKALAIKTTCFSAVVKKEEVVEGLQQAYHKARKLARKLEMEIWEETSGTFSMYIGEDAYQYPNSVGISWAVEKIKTEYGS